MRSTRNLILLALVTVAAVVGAWYARGPAPEVDHAGKPFLPALLARVNDATRIEITHQGKSFAITRSDSGWGVEQKNGYPADGSAVRTLLVGAARLTRVEPQTAKPEHYPKLGLGDPKKKDSKSTAIRILGSGGEVLADLIVGNHRFGGGGGTDEYFVREPSKPQSWLVSGTLPTAHVLLDWLDKTIVAVEHARVRMVTVTHPDGEVTTVERDRKDPDYQLSGVPAGRKIDGAWKVNDIGRTLEDLKLDDVMPVADSKFDQGKPGPKVVLTTYDGLRIRMDTAHDGGRLLAKLDAEFDPSLVEPAPGSGAKKAEGGSTAAGGADQKGADAKGGSAAKNQAKHDEAAVRGEAARLAARWKPWVYVLPAYKAGYVEQHMKDLLAPVGGAKKKGGAGGAQPSG